MDNDVRKISFEEQLERARAFSEAIDVHLIEGEDGSFAVIDTTHGKLLVEGYALGQHIGERVEMRWEEVRIAEELVDVLDVSEFEDVAQLALAAGNIWAVDNRRSLRLHIEA